jgi:hypothetical protein
LLQKRSKSNKNQKRKGVILAVTVTSSKIDITSGTETLKTIYTAVAASGFPGLMTENVADNAYTINGNIELEISSGATLNITDASYEDGYLYWGSLTANKAPGLDIARGSTFTCTAPGFTFNMDVNNGQYNYWYVYGDCTVTGTLAKPIVITRYYATRCYAYGYSINFDHVNFTDPSTYSTSSYPIYLDNATDGSKWPEAGEWSFTNITIDNRTDSGYIFRVYGGDWSNVILDNWLSDDTRYGFSGLGGHVKFTNSTFKHIQNYSTIVHSGVSGYMNSVYEATPMNKDLFQEKWTFENCTFEDNNDSSSTEYGFRLGYRGTFIKFKNCTFAGVDDALRYGISSHQYSKILLEGGEAGQTWTNVTDNKIYGSTHNYYDVYSLDLTVSDSGGSPIEDATVAVRQKEGHEHWMFRTDSNGNIKDLYGDLPVFAYQQQYGTSSFDVWSDGTGDQVHVIEIVKDGYVADTREVSFSSNKIITVTLDTNPANQTTIYDSVIYNSVIN